MNKVLALALLLMPLLHRAQVETQASGTEIYNALKKLQNTATVLYVAAHPDDENTRLISWFSNHEHVNTVYLSLTRGDGGQNLVGTEKGPLLGLLRTQELMEARKIDGGKQFFSRANDFGFSKTATETLEFWDEEEILADVVWAIRKWQPDIIVNRFDHDSNGKTHGHHTASAVLSMEAFDLAGDPAVFPDQLRYVSAWQPKRIYFNTSWWFYGSREAFAEADKSDMATVDIGAYYPLLGRSNNEIAAQSRSMHKCQGFGSAAARGSQEEYLQFLKGETPENMNDLFDNIDVSWSRVEGGEAVERLVEEAISSFDFNDPSKSVDLLFDIRRQIFDLPSTPLTKRKIEEVEQLIRWCSGLYAEVTASVSSVTPGDSLDLATEVIVRNEVSASIQSIVLKGLGQSILAEEANLAVNEAWEKASGIHVPEDLPYTSPYWLRETSDNPGMYVVRDQQYRGQPESDPVLTAEVTMVINGNTMTATIPVKYKYVDPAIGEIYQPLSVLPPVVANLDAPVYLFKNGAKGEITIRVKAISANQTGVAGMEAEGWRFEPSEMPFTLKQAGSEVDLTFAVYPPKGQDLSTLTAWTSIDGERSEWSLREVVYDHIDYQPVLQPSQAAIVNIEAAVADRKVAYLEGSGDEVAASIEQLGLPVTFIDKSNWRSGALDGFDVVVVGIRAFNVHQELAFFAEELWSFAEAGGTVIVQYNTSRGLKAEVAPVDLKLSRDRITQEDAPLTRLLPDHDIFNVPNEITDADFDGWVQERGLYFADQWPENAEVLLEGNDKGDESTRGMLIAIPYGEGYYVFTGLSFFRQLPAGVPGAYRLFANILSLKQ